MLPNTAYLEVFANFDWRNEYKIRNIYQTYAAGAGLWHRHDDCASIPDGGSVIARASRRYVRPSCRLMRIEHTSLQDGKVFSLWTAWFWYIPVASAIAHRKHLCGNTEPPGAEEYGDQVPAHDRRYRRGSHAPPSGSRQSYAGVPGVGHISHRAGCPGTAQMFPTQIG